MTQQLTDAAKICIAVTTILAVFAIAAVALRFYCRVIVQKIRLGPDDWCALLALVISTGIAIATSYAAAITGVGDPTFQPSLAQVIFALKMQLGLENAQVACMGIIKVSVLFYYQRILALPIYRTITYVIIVVVILFEFSLIMAIIFSKGLPISLQWDPFAPFHVNISAILLAFCAGNALLDLITLALPIVAVSSLQMSTNRKLLLSVIFSLGSFCVVASIVRLYYAVLFTQEPMTPNSFFQTPFILNSLWALIEPPIFILAGCLLTFAPLFRAKFNYGPASFLRSLRSALLKRKSTRRSDTLTSQKMDNANMYGKLHGESKRNLYKKEGADGSRDEGPLEAWDMVEFETTQERNERADVAV